jgi:hypothetical protein
MVCVARAECSNCRNWVRGYDVTHIVHKRGLPVMNSSVTGWCLLDVPPIAHPVITGWSEERVGVGMETRDTSVCVSHEE